MIAVTDSAATKVKELLDEEGDESLALRVAVHNGGCSGFSYEMFFDGETASNDQSIEHGGVRVIADPASAQLLVGATLDYMDGAQQTGFSIDNPNAAQQGCSCGGSES
ncbi:MAG: iron-sulfur cluster assembly accessory protein [Actinomycetia bacterium]|nr:iron-sulfur cluster assembly accessory protein [Actinomycetes bacterium]MCP4225690.1 iron-sulfur cluster assembly accessory protein [Actinomycetes bacterium]